ncbi:hypothetical protein BDZ89DRAFT_1129544 [Hymenopellis radicata]|nr:hypothetical protein BDZ89DRAFT_1129544 [Hymenopellis radicata]
MPVTLPQEIIDAIIDDVAVMHDVEPHAPISAGNAASTDLYACALTSSTFLLRARRHIFRQIMLFPHGDIQRIATFAFNPNRARKTRKSITSRFIDRVQPSTATLVESVIVVGSLGGGTDLEEWASIDPDFRLVFASLTSLRSITLRRFMIRSLHATTLHSIFANLIIRSVTFAGVHMQNGAMPPFFLLFPRMESLEILPAAVNDSSWPNAIFWIPLRGDRAVLQESLLPRPQSLTLMEIDGGELFRLLRHPWPLQLNRIHHLECSFSWYGTEQLVSLNQLMANMSALAHLTLGFRDSDYQIERFPSLPFHRLTSLAIRASLPSGGYDDIQLEHMQMPTPWNLYVRSLTMPDHIYYLEDFQLSLTFTDDAGLGISGVWRDLPSALVRLPTLRRVTFVVVSDSTDGGIQRECTALYHGLVAVLEKEGDSLNSLLAHADVTIKLEGRGADGKMNPSVAYRLRGN